MKNFAPHTVGQDEELITRMQQPDSRPFAAGVFADIPASTIPRAGLTASTGYRSFDESLEPAAGCRVWSNTVLPGLPGRTGYSLVKTGTSVVKSVGTNFTSADIGCFIVHDDGIADLITACLSSTEVTVDNSTARAASSAGFVRGPTNCTEKHQTKQKIITHIDNRIFISTPEIGAYTEAYNISKASLSSVKSRIYENGDFAIIICDGKIFRLDLQSTPYFFWQINDPSPSVFITAVARTLTRTFGYKYIYTMSRISGTSDIRDRTTAGSVIEHETAPLPLNSSGKDYSEIYSDRPVGAALTTYGILTGAALVAPYDNPAGWSAITNGQFVIALNGVDYTVAIDFTGCLTMSDVAAYIQAALRAFSTTITCVYTVDHFVITMTEESETIGFSEAGPAGTDIGSTAMRCEFGTGIVTNPTYSKKLVVGNMRVAVDGSSNKQFHHTHYSRYRTLDFGVAGINPINGEGNNEEQFVWESDIPVAKAFKNATSYKAGQIDWVAIPGNPIDFARCICYGNGLFVAVGGTYPGDTDIYTSPDGDNWTKRIVVGAEHQSWRGVCYGSGKFVAVGEISYGGEEQTAVSLDGIVWTPKAAAAGEGWQSVTYGLAMFVAVANTGTGNRVMTSVDGETWVIQASAADDGWRKVRFGNGLFVAVAPTGTNRIMVSANGTAWVAKTPPLYDYYDVDYGGGKWCACSAMSSKFVTSPDADTWTDSATYHAVGITYANGMWVSISEAGYGFGTGYAATSADAITWTARNLDFSLVNGSGAIAYGLGLFVIARAHSGNFGGTGNFISVAAGNFSLQDEGAKLLTIGGTEYTISTYINATNVSVVENSVVTNESAAIGGDASVSAIRIMLASRSAQTVTRTAGATFTAADVGKTIFWAGGVRAHIIAYLTANTVTTAESGTIAATGACIDPVCRYATDSTPDDTLRARIASYSMMHRFTQPFPSVDLFDLVPGFIFCALRNDTYYYYSTVALGKEYLMGAYNPSYQLDRTNDPIRAIRDFPDYVVIYCANSRLKIPINTWLTTDINGIISVIVISGRYLQQDQIGLRDYTAITRLPDGTDYLVTGEPAVRIYDGKQFSANLAKDRYMKEIELFQEGLSILYDPFNGISIYGPTTTGKIYAQKCVRHGIKPAEHGVGFYDMPVADMPMPEIRVGVLSISDSNSIIRGIVLDYRTGKWYDVTTRHGPAGSGMSVSWKGISGQNIQRSFKLAEDRGAFEHQKIRHLTSHLFVRPYNELNRNQTGYDVSGYPTELEIDLKFYVDGEPTTETTKIADIFKTGGDLKTDRRVEGSRIQLEVVSNTGDHIVTQRQQYYAQQNGAADPDNSVSNEMDWQAELSETLFWMSVNGIE